MLHDGRAESSGPEAAGVGSSGEGASSKSATDGFSSEILPTDPIDEDSATKNRVSSGQKVQAAPKHNFRCSEG